MDYKDFIQLQNQENLYFWYEAKKNLIYNLLNSVFKNYTQNRLILNIGCGTGTELAIIKKFGQTKALDNNLNALELAKKQGCKIILADIEKYKLQDNHYDAICCFDLLEHLQNDQVVVKNIFQSLKKDGYFFFTIPAFQILFSSHDIAMEHYRRYNKKDILNKLTIAGFKITKLNYWNSFLFPVIVIIRLFKKIIIKLFPKIKYHSEVKNLNKYLNKLLFLILNLENSLIFFNKLRIPFGLTIYGVAKK